MPSLLMRVLPPTPLARALAGQSILFAVGEGRTHLGSCWPTCSARTRCSPCCCRWRRLGALGGTIGQVWAPTAYTFLAIEWGPPGWAVIAAIVVVAAICLHPATRAAERYLEQHTSAPEPAPA